MKKVYILVFIMILALCGCSNAEENSNVKSSDVYEYTTKKAETVEVSENAFVAKINEIYTNTDNYLGDNIIIEGCFEKQTYNDKEYYYVYRTGPGCCGNDGAMCGFEFTYNGDIPTTDDWIRVEGILDKYEEDGQTYLTLNASKVDVLTQRGLATVS